MSFVGDAGCQWAVRKSEFQYHFADVSKMTTINYITEHIPLPSEAESSTSDDDAVDSPVLERLMP